MSKLITLGYDRARGYYESAENVKGLRLMVAKKELKTNYAAAQRYWHKVCGAEWRKVSGGNLQWVLRITSNGWEFEVPAAWLTAKGIVDVLAQLGEAEQKMIRAFKKELKNLTAETEYLPESRPDICLVQASLWNNSLAKVLRGHPLDEARICKLLNVIKPTIYRHL